MAEKNIFIVGMDDFNRKKLEALPQAKKCNFHAALEIGDIRGVNQFDIEHLIGKANRTIAESGLSVDGVASYYDFPGTVIAAILAEQYSLPGPDLESMLKCENKYWSRMEQKKVIPEHIPHFRAFDPFDSDAFDKIGILPPFWIKPIKSFRSYLAFHINDKRQFRTVMPVCREGVGFIGDPFTYLMRQFGVPPEIAEMPEVFIAESQIGGLQCTLEGYCFDGQVHVYGVVDSVREQDSSSFAHYAYPSRLPMEIQHRMIDVIRAALQQIGLDNTPFNAEFFYDQTSDHLWLLEINPRISQAHSDIFEKVQGVSNLSIMVDLALGHKPKPMERKGTFNIAGHFMLRTKESGRILRIPSSAAIEKLKRRQAGTLVKIPVKPGQHLKDLQGQDMYSFEIANVFIGGRDEAEMLDRYDEALAVLQFDIEKDPDTVIT